MISESKRNFLKLVGLAALTITPFGCATRPDLLAEEGFKLNPNTHTGKITQDDSRYHMHEPIIFKEIYYYGNTPIGEALLKKDDTNIWDRYKVEKGKINSSGSYVSSEVGGVYILEPALNKDGTEKRRVNLDPEYLKAIMKDPTIVEGDEYIGVACETEEDRQYKIPYINLGGGHFVIPVEVEKDSKKRGDKNYYPFYTVDIDGIHTGTNSRGKISLFNPGKIKIPVLHSWGEINRSTSKLSPKERKITEEILKPFGLKAISSQ